MSNGKMEVEMLLGVFDSGIGGEAVATKLRELLPSARVISINDHENVPYGTKAPAEIIRLTTQAIQPLIQQSCDAIIIACNTATTVAMTHLRKTYPKIHFIGIEPMIKPASQLTKTNRVAVLATPQTLKSSRYNELKALWGSSLTIYEPDCRNWATLIEHGQSDQINIAKVVEPLLTQGVDVFVLACTHYHWLKKRFDRLIGSRAIILEPTDAVAQRIQSLLK